jgi:hypothetical protein
MLKMMMECLTGSTFISIPAVAQAQAEQLKLNSRIESRSTGRDRRPVFTGRGRISSEIQRSLFSDADGPGG